MELNFDAQLYGAVGAGALYYLDPFGFPILEAAAGAYLADMLLEKPKKWTREWVTIGVLLGGFGASFVGVDPLIGVLGGAFVGPILGNSLQNYTIIL
jgi:hypothetical protein